MSWNTACPSNHCTSSIFQTARPPEPPPKGNKPRAPPAKATCREAARSCATFCKERADRAPQKIGSETFARLAAKVLGCLHNRPELPVPGADILKPCCEQSRGLLLGSIPARVHGPWDRIDVQSSHKRPNVHAHIVEISRRFNIAGLPLTGTSRRLARV